MYYVDTNILVSALTPEPVKHAARAWLVDHQDATFVSDWVITEFSSALSVKSRFTGLSDVDRSQALDGLSRYISTSLTVLPVGRNDFRTATRWCGAPELGLRAGDALHLAVASTHELTVITRDQVMVAAARELGLDVVLFEEPA